jgi:hypothetical protein
MRFDQIDGNCTVNDLLVQVASNPTRNAPDSAFIHQDTRVNDNLALLGQLMGAARNALITVAC